MDGCDGSLIKVVQMPKRENGNDVTSHVAGI